jgi:TonB family protein
MLYQTGQSRARPYTVGVDRTEILLADKQGLVVDVLNPIDWDLRLDGTDDTHVILEDLARGQRLVCDVKFLDALLESVTQPALLAKAKKLKKEIKERSPADVSATALLCVLVVGFIAWIVVGLPVSMNAYKTQLANAPAVINMGGSDREQYMRGVGALIERRWKPPICEEDRDVILRFDVSRNGKPVNIKVMRSSGDSSFDDHAKISLRSGTFDPLPDSLGQSVPLEFTFSYKKSPLSGGR